MRITLGKAIRATLLISLMVSATVLSTRLRADTGTCGGASITLPFTDVPNTNIFFCPIAEAYFSALTNGTTATTYNPSDPVPREQIAAFMTRTMDQSLKRGGRRAALKQWWTPTSSDGLGLTNVESRPAFVESDGADLWLTVSNSVARVRASDAKLLETWTGAASAGGVLAAKGLIFVTGATNPGKLYRIDPTQIAGAVTTLTDSLGDSPIGVAFDGARIWTANLGGSVSIVTLNSLSVNTVTTGFISLRGILYDGANMWVTDQSAGKLFKLDSSGGIIQTVNVGIFPQIPVFDGTNIWVPNFSSGTVTVVRASTGAVLATLTDDALDGPNTAAFDGERILITNENGNSVALWKATDLSPIGSVNTGNLSAPNGACSDGINFWVTLYGTNQLMRF